MNLEEFKKVLNDELQNNKITEKKLNIETLYKYMIKILEWNKKINLTAIKEEREFITKHFIDSLTISEFIDENSNLIDIGTGAGFPGMPLKIASL